MGCVSSKKDINDVHPNIFEVCLELSPLTVLNIDDGGNGVSPGQLEVTDTELIFHQRGRPAVHWPLRSLRRYGYDYDIHTFSFEAGRRCPTGSGIYSFCCDRAEKLFNFVQTNMRNNEDTASMEVGTPTPVQTRPSSGTFLEPAPICNINAPVLRQMSLPRLTINTNQTRLNSVGSSNSCISPSPPPNSASNNNEASDFFPTEVPQNVYMNVGCGNVPLEIDEEDDSHAYVNMSIAHGDNMAISTEEIPTVNYALLDLDKRSDKHPLPPPESPNRPTLGYITIDFDKTVALSHSIHPTFENEGSRKTRHNSTINDLLPQPHKRHGSSVSD